jgi:hypothetical protein
MANRFEKYASSGGGGSNRFARYASQPEEMNAFQSALSGAGDAISFGWGDELQGALFGEDARDAARRRQELARANHGGAFLAGQIGGSLVGGFGVGGVARAGARLLPGAARMAQGVGWLPRIGVGAATGAAGGALYGAGDAGENMRMQGASEGALSGAAFGALGQGAGEVVNRVGGAVRRGMSSNARAADMIGGMQQRFGQTGDDFMNALRDAPDNAIVGDVIPGGSQIISGAGARPSAGRDALREFYDQRNNAAGPRAANDLWETLAPGAKRNSADEVTALIEVQRKEAAPLYAQVYQQRIPGVPKPLRDFVTFNNRPGARFQAALETTRETMRRAMGANATDEAMQTSPMFWHRLLENVESEVGASIRSARINPLGGPRGSAIADMTQDARAFNTQVRRMLGADFRKAQDIYAGSAKAQNAVEFGESMVTAKGDLQLGQTLRVLNRMGAAERQQAQYAAISALRSAMETASSGTGRANALRALLGNETKRRMLRTLFGGEQGFSALMKRLEGQQRLFNNSVESGIGVNSHTADRLLAAQSQASRTDPTAGGLKGAALRLLTGDAADQYQEGVSNQILETMRVPASQALADINSAGGLQQWTKGRGLLSRAAARRDELSKLRPRRLTEAFSTGLYAPVVGGGFTGYGGM